MKSIFDSLNTSETMHMVVGFAGPAGSGKTTSAVAMQLYLQPYNVCLTKHFATPLKSMVKSLVASLGMDECSGKDAIICGDKTVRYALQTLGTDWGRTLMGPDLWLRCMDAQLNLTELVPTIVFIDDVRFRNEIDYIHDLGGVVAWVKPGGAVLNKHAIITADERHHISENAISANECDFIIRNNRDVYQEMCITDYGKYIAGLLQKFVKAHK